MLVGGGSGAPAAHTPIFQSQPNPFTAKPIERTMLVAGRKSTPPGTQHRNPTTPLKRPHVLCRMRLCDLHLAVPPLHPWLTASSFPEQCAVRTSLHSLPQRLLASGLQRQQPLGTEPHLISLSTYPHALLNGCLPVIQKRHKLLHL
jgi:hypothetical protein